MIAKPGQISVIHKLWSGNLWYNSVYIRITDQKTVKNCGILEGTIERNLSLQPKILQNILLWNVLCYSQRLGRSLGRPWRDSLFSGITKWSLQTYHVYSTLKRRGNNRFYVASTWNTHDMFVGILKNFEQQIIFSQCFLLTFLINISRGVRSKRNFGKKWANWLKFRTRFPLLLSGFIQNKLYQRFFLKHFRSLMNSNFRLITFPFLPDLGK